MPFSEFLHKLYTDPIFTRHLRVDLSRLDPGAPKQRFRFMLGDFGIVPTTGMKEILGQNGTSWMADRLAAWLLPVCDVDILETDNTGSEYSVGRNARWV